MPNDQIINFIKQSKSAGQTDEQVKSALKSAGWQEADINDGFKSVESPLRPAGLSEAPAAQKSMPTINYSNFSYGRREEARIGQKTSSGRKLIIILIASLFLSALGTMLYFYTDKLADLPIIRNIF